MRLPNSMLAITNGRTPARNPTQVCHSGTVARSAASGGSEAGRRSLVRDGAEKLQRIQVRTIVEDVGAEDGNTFVLIIVCEEAGDVFCVSLDVAPPLSLLDWRQEGEEEEATRGCGAIKLRGARRDRETTNEPLTAHLYHLYLYWTRNKLPSFRFACSKRRDRQRMWSMRSRLAIPIENHTRFQYIPMKLIERFSTFIASYLQERRIDDFGLQQREENFWSS